MTNLLSVVLVSVSHTREDSSPVPALFSSGLGILEQS